MTEWKNSRGAEDGGAALHAVAAVDRERGAGDVAEMRTMKDSFLLWIVMRSGGVGAPVEFVVAAVIAVALAAAGIVGAARSAALA